jgi:hypothetical protein
MLGLLRPVWALCDRFFPYISVSTDKNSSFFGKQVKEKRIVVEWMIIKERFYRLKAKNT